MRANYHNKISISANGNVYDFYNTMFSNVYQKIANFDTFFDKIAIGSGFCADFSQNYKLGTFLYLENLKSNSVQIDPSEDLIYIEKTAIIDTKKIKSNYITEAGITSNLDNTNNPDIYNYFTFISDDLPNGIDISNNEQIAINITIYLTLSNSSDGLLTKGNNTFLNLLLGNGANEKNVYVARGNDISDNEFIFRSNDYLDDKHICSFTHSESDDVLNLTFDGDLGAGETDEIVFILDNSIFARVNVKNLQSDLSVSETKTSLSTYVIDLGFDVTDVESVCYSEDGSYEDSYFVSKYANNFSSKTHLPFNNLFNNDTTRYLSLDGNKIFFILNDTIYMFKNTNYNVELVFASNIQVQNILKLTAFDDFVFVFTQASPCIHAYKVINNSLTACEVDLSEFEALSSLETFTLIDIVQAKNGTFMLGFVVPSDTKTIAYTLYLEFDETTNKFSFTDYVSSGSYTFTYIMPMHKNNFSDAQFMYCQHGERANLCRRALHDINRKVASGYNILAYYYTTYTVDYYVKSRAIITVKEYENVDKIWMYYYPQVYRVNMPEFNEAEKTYFSTNLMYIIQKMPDGSYRAFNIIGYENPVIFSSGIPSEIDQSKILSVEFLEDTVLFFMNDSTEPIIAYNLNITGTCIENVLNKETEYLVTYSKKQSLGSQTQGVTAKFAVNVTI